MMIISDGAGYVDHGVDFEEEYGDGYEDEEGGGRSKKGNKDRKKEKKGL